MNQPLSLHEQVSQGAAVGHGEVCGGALQGGHGHRGEVGRRRGGRGHPV